MKNKKTTFFVVLAIVLTAGIYYFYSKRNDEKSTSDDGANIPDGKLYTYEWIGCNSCPTEGVSSDMLELNSTGFGGIHIGGGFVASGKVKIGDEIQILNNQGSDVEGTYKVVGIGAGCQMGASGYPNLIVIDLMWNCSTNISPMTSNGGVLRIIRK